jgi:DNA-binding PadR family transcriptional regulator
MDHLTPTAACILGLLEMGPTPGAARVPGPDAMTGWQISSTAESSLARFWHVTRSQIYAELARLAEAGLVEDTGEGGPRSSRPYRITDAGRSAFRDWLTDWVAQEPKDDQLRSPLLLTMFFGMFLPDEKLRRILQEYRPRYQRQLDQLSRMFAIIEENQRRIPPSQVLRRGVAYRELMIHWIDEVLVELPTGDEESE